MFERWWPADVHVIGKDITRFHAVIWPAMLMAGKLPLPRQVFGHGFMTVNGQRMSKSLRHRDPDPIEAAVRFRTGSRLRLLLIKEIAVGGDGDFSWDRYDERYNVDLANNLGNLVSRVAAMVHQSSGPRLTGGRVGATSDQTRARWRRSRPRTTTGGPWTRFALHSRRQPPAFRADRRDERVHRGDGAMGARQGSGAAADRLTQVLFDAAEAIRLAAVLLAPIMPRSSAEILRRVGAADGTIDMNRDGRWRNEGERVLAQDPPVVAADSSARVWLEREADRARSGGTPRASERGPVTDDRPDTATGRTTASRRCRNPQPAAESHLHRATS